MDDLDGRYLHVCVKEAYIQGRYCWPQPLRASIASHWVVASGRKSAQSFIIHLYTYTGFYRGGFRGSDQDNSEVTEAATRRRAQGRGTWSW